MTLDTTTPGSGFAGEPGGYAVRTDAVVGHRLAGGYMSLHAPGQPCGWCDDDSAHDGGKGPLSETVSGTQSLGEQLMLLALIPYKGIVKSQRDVGFGLMGAELAALALAGRIELAGGRIMLACPAGLTTADPDLDAALAALAAAGRPPRPVSWVGRPRRHIVESYLARLTATGAVSRQGRWLTAKWPIVDETRASAARAGVDALAMGPGQTSTAHADPAQLALAGLVDATDLSKQLYPGWGSRAARGRLRQIAREQWIADAVSRSVDKARAAAGG